MKIDYIKKENKIITQIDILHKGILYSFMNNEGRAIEISRRTKGKCKSPNYEPGIAKGYYVDIIELANKAIMKSLKKKA
jgi:hypothetical protein